jgi:2-keto-4-pentenoate hydratase/2-oxohepta-3-ene-1,7-dioic acid hydratase in catechol pathway
MKIARILHEGEARLASLLEGELILLDKDADLLEILSLSPAEQKKLEAKGKKLGALERKNLLSPIEPKSMRDFMTFEQHLIGAIKWVNPTGSIAQEWFEAPCFYFTNHLAAIGAHDDVEFPPNCEVLDFELELAVVLKKGGRNDY